MTHIKKHTHRLFSYECQCQEKSFTGLHCEITYNENQSFTSYLEPIIFTLVAGVSCFIFWRGRTNLNRAESRKRNIKGKRKNTGGSNYQVEKKDGSSKTGKKQTINQTHNQTNTQTNNQTNNQKNKSKKGKNSAKSKRKRN